MEPGFGDLLYSREGTYFGMAAEVPKGVKVCLGQRMVLLRPDPRQANPTFLRFLLNSSQIQSYIHGHRDGSVAERLNLPTIRQLPVCLPKLSEQRMIADILAHLDQKVELHRKTNETLEAIARAIFKSWFVDFEPVRAKAEGGEPEGIDAATATLFPDAFEAAELGAIPKGWTVSTISDIASVIDCLHSKKPRRLDAGKPFLQLCNIADGGLLDLSDLYYISDEDYEKWVSRLEATEGDCLITNVGRVGAVAQIPTGIRAALGRNMTGIRCKMEFPYPTFLIELLTSSSMREEIALKTDSGTILDSLNVRSIPSLRFIRPAVAPLRHFEHVTRPLRQRMELSLTQGSTLASLRDTLLPRLISGKLQVPEAEKLVEAVL